MDMLPARPVDSYCRACGYIAAAEPADRKAIRDMANALQVAVLISAESPAKSRFADAGTLQLALKRAVIALRRLQRPQRGQLKE
jgi:hypothetical protein